MEWGRSACEQFSPKKIKRVSDFDDANALWTKNLSCSHKTNLPHKEKAKDKQSESIPPIGFVKYYHKIVRSEKLRQHTKTMILTMTKSVLLAMLSAAGTSVVSAEPTTRIVGGQKADPGEYPYFSE